MPVPLHSNELQDDPHQDQGMFAIPIKIGKVGVKKVMCDLGASINVVPLSIYQSLNVGLLKETGVVIQLADRSIIYPEGVLEDVLVQVGNLVFPADFYIVHMDDDRSSNTYDLLLGRPFLTTARIKIDVFDGTLTIEFDEKIIKFNVYGNMKYPNDFSNVCEVDIIKPLVQQVFELQGEDELTTVMYENLIKSKLVAIRANFVLQGRLKDIVHELEANKIKCNVSTLELPTAHSKILPSVVQAPQLELKLLLVHLKYAYIGLESSLPVIISNKLTPYEEEELI
ncbi:uncharacterized protein LOC110627581 [Manihot esculenta]|uniref:uncharacterized protein LOC110627581 n=1 Tax=Manihot esculenta TaxID=3983 RepID=UPI000B5D5886|nr:uncharacterized protein LOC110627581 [Manihot esculenta]